MKDFQKNSKKTLDKSSQMWYNEYAENLRKQSVFTVKFLRNFKKPLDKSSQVWYNEYADKKVL